jgi:hypothetical protein
MRAQSCGWHGSSRAVVVEAESPAPIAGLGLILIGRWDTGLFPSFPGSTDTTKVLRWDFE